MGLAAAAVWGFFLLFYLRRRDAVDVAIRKAESDIESDRKRLEIDLAGHQRDIQQKELEIKELQLKTRRQVAVCATIDAEISRDGEGYLIIATVALTNQGNDATAIMWEGEPPPFAIRRISFTVTGEAECGKALELRVMLTRDPAVPARSHIVRSGATEFLAFAARVTEPGLYLLSFRGATAADVRREAEKYGIRLPTAWTAKRYIRIGGEATERPAAEQLVA